MLIIDISIDKDNSQFDDNDPDQFRMYRKLSEKERNNLSERIKELEDVCRNALTSLTITMLPLLDNNIASDIDIIKIVISSLEQALKEDK